MSPNPTGGDIITEYLYNLCTFGALTVFILLCKFFFLKMWEEKVYSRGVLERDLSGYSKQNFFSLFFCLTAFLSFSPAAAIHINIPNHMPRSLKIQPKGRNSNKTTQ